MTKRPKKQFFFQVAKKQQGPNKLGLENFWKSNKREGGLN